MAFAPVTGGRFIIVWTAIRNWPVLALSNSLGSRPFHVDLQVPRIHAAVPRPAV